jgi:hypothetical protein
MPGNPNSSKASRSNMGSNRATDYSTGGGDKKAGLVPTMQMTQARFRAFNSRGLPLSFNLAMLNPNGTPNISNVCIGRPIGSTAQFNLRWKCR